MTGARPTTAMTWAQLPAPTRRRIAVLLSHLLRRPLARAPVAEDLGHDRFPPGNEGRDVPPREGSGAPSRSLAHRLRPKVAPATTQIPPGAAPPAIRPGRARAATRLAP